MRRSLNFAFCAIVLALMACQLFVPPALSVANDHDFEKLLGPFCLGPAPESAAPDNSAAYQTNPYFDYTVLRFTWDPDSCIEWPMRTTNQAAFRVGLWLDHVFYSKTDFDLRFMGVVYGLIFFAGFLSLQRALRYVPLPVSIVAQSVWIVVVCNAVYVPMLNTLYFDAMSLATLTGALASVGVVIFGKRVSAGSILTASVWLALLAGSKGQHAPMALLFIPAVWLPWIANQPRIIIARSTGTALIVAGAWLSMSTMPRYYQGEATFNALFYRILPTVADPAAYLAETHIPPSWARYAGEVAFAEDVPLRDPVYEEQFGTWFGPADLIRLYLRHPSAAWLIARENLDEASMDRVRIRMAGVPHRLGNYPQSLGKPPQTISHFFTMWAAAKNAIFGGRPVAWLIYILIVIGAAWTLAPSYTPARALLAIVTLSLAIEFAICMLDGADGGRHLTLFSFLLDLLFCCDVVFAAAKLSLHGADLTIPGVFSNPPQSAD
jgi:hypothetical protein